MWYILFILMFIFHQHWSFICYKKCWFDHTYTLLSYIHHQYDFIFVQNHFYSIWESSYIWVDCFQSKYLRRCPATFILLNRTWNICAFDCHLSVHFYLILNVMSWDVTNTKNTGWWRYMNHIVLRDCLFFYMDAS